MNHIFKHQMNQRFTRIFLINLFLDQLIRGNKDTLILSLYMLIRIDEYSDFEILFIQQSCLIDTSRFSITIN